MAAMGHQRPQSPALRTAQDTTKKDWQSGQIVGHWGYLARTQ
jgi:hypothetical protein